MSKNPQTHIGIQRRVINLLKQVERLGDEGKFIDAAEYGGFALGYIQAQRDCGNLTTIQYNRLRTQIREVL